MLYLQIDSTCFLLLQELKRNRNKKPVVIEHTIYLKATKTGPVALDEIVWKVRNSIKYQRNWLMDPNYFALTQGKVTSRPVTLQIFLSKDLPPFDSYLSEGGLSRQIRSNRTCPRLLVHNNVNTYPLSCETNEVSPVNQICRMFCESSFVLVGDELTVCLPNGMWSGRQAWCVKFCPVLAAIDHGRIVPYACQRADAPVASHTRCIYYCDRGYRLSGSFHRECQEDGSWDYDKPVCKVQCPILSLPRYGKLTPSRCSTESSTEGDVCTFSCSDGFVMQGESFTTCDSNGR